MRRSTRRFLDEMEDATNGILIVMLCEPRTSSKRGRILEEMEHRMALIVYAYLQLSRDLIARADRRAQSDDIQAMCQACKTGLLREGKVIKTYRVDKDTYICNYGEEKAGTWMHENEWGEHRQCEASAIREMLFQKKL